MIWWLMLGGGGPVVGALTGALFWTAERIDNTFQRLRRWRRWFAETDEAQLDNLVVVLREEVEHEAEPWPTRLTPTDFETPAPAPLQSRLRRAIEPPAREQVIVRAEVDASGCNVPCTARHCAEHAGVLGTVAQRRHSRAEEQRLAHLAWNTDTAEWSVSLLGLEVPDFLEVRSPIYAEVAT